jgi:hypothetical protein
MSDDLRNAFRSAAGREPAVGDAWARFETAKRRNSTMRTLVAVVVGVAAFIALILILPGINPGEGDSPINSGESIEPRPPTASKHYKDARGGFQLDFPAAWIGRGFTDESADFFPEVNGLTDGSSLMNVDGGGARPVRATANGFFIRIHVRHPGDDTELSDRGDLARRREAGAAIKEGGIFPPHEGQVRGQQLRAIYPAAPVEPPSGWSDGPPRYWCGGCIVEELTIERPGASLLEVLIIAPGQDAYDAYHALALSVLDTIDDYVAPTATASPDRI